MTPEAVLLSGAAVVALCAAGVFALKRRARMQEARRMREQLERQRKLDYPRVHVREAGADLKAGDAVSMHLDGKAYPASAATRWWQCNLCEYSTRFPSMMDAHSARHHQGKAEGIFNTSG